MRQLAGSQPRRKQSFLSGAKEPEQGMTQFADTCIADTRADPGFAVALERLRVTASTAKSRTAKSRTAKSRTAKSRTAKSRTAKSRTAKPHGRSRWLEPR